MTKEEIIEIIHKTIYQFFDVCGDNEEVPLSDKDKLLLSVNKAICNNIKALCESSSENPNKWIPCSERLPEIHDRTEKYLVTLEHGGTYVALFTECDGKHWWAYDDVVAWQPLPKPYKEMESEE